MVTRLSPPDQLLLIVLVLCYLEDKDNDDDNNDDDNNDDDNNDDDNNDDDNSDDDNNDDDNNDDNIDDNNDDDKVVLTRPAATPMKKTGRRERGCAVAIHTWVVQKW